MGYTKHGAKFTSALRLNAGTPGFSCGLQVTGQGAAYNHNIYVYILSDWRSAWCLLYQPLTDAKKRKKEIKEALEDANASWLSQPEIISKIPTKHQMESLKTIIKLPEHYTTDKEFHESDEFLTKSLHGSELKARQDGYYNEPAFRNVREYNLTQKGSSLCVVFSMLNLIIFALEKDLNVETSVMNKFFTQEKLLYTLAMQIYPRSLAFLNLNHRKEEKKFQPNRAINLLDRLKYPTYLSNTGWKILCDLYKNMKPSQCIYEKVDLKNIDSKTIWRPVTVTGFMWSDLTKEPSSVHQMVIDDLDQGEFILNIHSSDQTSVKIPKSRSIIDYRWNKDTEKWDISLDPPATKCVNTWYLFPEAYSFTAKWI
ncbi:unnamed protein product [Oikopleura dioica]|uniref:Uncharacterized protein n=1 Tax=Oikopleura dioica TaxID=34765 RepID=E4XJ14_OIKDI|nr:unnamed protein product [Oikopleura dioica]